LIAVILIGSTCAVLGVYVVLRQMAFIGDAMAHAALPGLVGAVIFNWPPIFGALVADLLTAIGIGVISKRKAIREDTAIGIFFTGMFAAGIVIMAHLKTYNDLTHMLIGNILDVTYYDLILMAVVAVIVLTTLGLLHKEFELSTVDPDYSTVIGLNVDRLRFILLILLALTVVTTIQVVGVVLTSAMLVTPAATASLLTKRLIPMMLIALVVAIASGLIGLVASACFTLSSGAAIVLTCTLMFLTTYGVKQAVS
jgi:manganese/iron transport system permease protein